MNDPSVRIYLPRRCDVMQAAISPPVAAMPQDDDPAAPDIRIRPRQAAGRSALVLTLEVDVGEAGTQRYDLVVDTNGKPSLRGVRLSAAELTADAMADAAPTGEPAGPTEARAPLPTKPALLGNLR